MSPNTGTFHSDSDGKSIGAGGTKFFIAGSNDGPKEMMAVPVTTSTV